MKRLDKLPWRKRLGTKITLLTCTLVVIFTGAYIILSIQDQRDLLIEEVIRSVSTLSDTIKLSCREDMLHYSPDRLHQFVDTIGSSTPLRKSGFSIRWAG